MNGPIAKMDKYMEVATKYGMTHLGQSNFQAVSTVFIIDPNERYCLDWYMCFQKEKIDQL